MLGNTSVFLKKEHNFTYINLGIFYKFTHRVFNEHFGKRSYYFSSSFGLEIEIGTYWWSILRLCRGIRTLAV